MRKNKGFTLIELLVVIAVIGLLSTIVMVSLNKARAKARDAKRKTDLKQLQTAVEMYINEYGAPPVTSSYGEANGGGWDSSYEGDFMQFLKGIAGSANPKNIQFMSSVPKDPQNSGTGDCSSFSGYHYCYYYYTVPSWGIPAPHYRIGCKLETGGIYWLFKTL